MSALRFRHETTGQLRAFRLLTLAQLVHLEHMGLGIGEPPSAKRAAMAALNIAGDGSSLTAGDLIDRLRAAARESVGMAESYGSAPDRPYMPDGDDTEPTT